MSDDLVEMARLAQHDERMATGALYGDLADRIEKLEADRKKTYEALLKVTRIYEEVEAKLAKAVEALEQAKGFVEGEYACAESQALQGEYVAKEARQVWAVLCTTLAELTGGKNA